MRLKITCLVCLAMILSPCLHGKAAVFPGRPGLPKQSGEELVSVIIVAKEGQASYLYKTILEKYEDIKIRQKYENVFNGFSVEGKRKDVERLMKEHGVESAAPVSSYKVTLDKSVPFIGGGEARSLFDKNGHRLTGKGVTVGVIDTGIDYSHSDLRRSYKGGYDFVDSDSDPMETKSSQGSPTYHGTHVAGIIAANGKLKGVAPEAEIIAYRALGPGGAGTSEQVIAAIDQAVKDKVDILNLSLGNEVNGPDWPTSIALDKAVEKGIVAVASSGNSGPSVWTVGSPGTSSKAITVGASTPPLDIPFLKIPFHDREIELSPLQGSKPWTFSRAIDIVEGGIGKSGDLKNVKDKAVLMERGILTFTKKAQNAERAGARAILIYNNVKGSFAGSLEYEPKIPVVSLSKSDGLWLKKNLKEGTALIETKYKSTEDTLAEFSSKGPVTRTWDIKPDIVAPGVEIDSPVPGGYLSLQGTSMAAPHVAGACALIKQAHPDWTPGQIKAAVMNSAHELRNVKGLAYAPHEQGAGRLQIKEAIDADVLVIPGSMAFGQVRKTETRTERSVMLTIENHSEKRETYSFEFPAFRKGIQWKLPPAFELGPGEARQVEAAMDINPDALKPGLHHGRVKLQSGSKSVSLPYLLAVEEPDYPRIMGFDSGFGDEEGVYKYEVYLPGGADEFGIALYDPDAARFVDFLDWKRDVPNGLLESEVNIDGRRLKGVYKALVFAKKGGREDTIEAEIVLEAERERKE